MQERLEVLRLCAKDLTFFGKCISETSFTLPSPDFHYEVDEVLMDRSITQLLIEAPRGTAKSTKARIFVHHHYIYDEGEKVIVIQSKTRKEAIKRLWKIKDTIEYNPKYRDLYGYHGEQTADSWREDYIKFKFGGNWVTIVAIGTGQQIRGVLEGDTRITLYLLDDPDDEDNTKTIEATEANFSKFLGGLAGLDRVRKGRCIIIGTPIGEGCIVARLRGATGWVTRNYPACNEETGECLWEEMYSFKWLMDKKKELDEAGMLWKFYSEYMCELKGKDDQIFKNENFRWFEGELELGKNGEHYLCITKRDEVDIELKIPVHTFMGVDPAFSVNPKADYSVIMTVAITKDRDYYVLPFIRKRMLSSELLDSIKSEYKKYLPLRVTIETTAAQDTLRQSLLMEAEYIPGLSSKTPPPKDSKHKRYVDVLEDIHRRKKLILHTSCLRLKEEMVMHPSLSGHDDTIDGLYWAVKKAYPPDHEVKKEEIQHVVRPKDFSQYVWMN